MLNFESVQIKSIFDLSGRKPQSDGNMRLDFHEVLLDFEKTLGAIAFKEWWENGGIKQFTKWISTHPRFKILL